MTCAIKDCQQKPERHDDVFCPEHWKTLPAWARRELVRLRARAARGNRQAVSDFMKASAVARTLVRAELL